MGNSRYIGKGNEQKPFKVVLFCGSAGSMDVLECFLTKVKPEDNVAIVVLLHRKRYGQDNLVKYFKNKAKVEVRAIEHGLGLHSGCIHVVPADYHCILEKDLMLSLDMSEKIMFSRPSADVSLESFSYHLKERLIAIIVSGANEDGANGAKWVSKRKGKIIVQKPSEAFAKKMPGAAIEAVDRVDHIVNASEIYDTAAKYF